MSKQRKNETAEEYRLRHNAEKRDYRRRALREIAGLPTEFYPVGAKRKPAEQLQPASLRKRELRAERNRPIVSRKPRRVYIDVDRPPSRETSGDNGGTTHE